MHLSPFATNNMYIKSATDSWWGGRTELQSEDWLSEGGSSSFRVCVAVLACVQSVCFLVTDRKWVDEGFP